MKFHAKELGARGKQRLDDRRGSRGIGEPLFQPPREARTLEPDGRGQAQQVLPR
ncbi:hypothetical protein NVS55_12650 [Myxococcus stipitatus]|uniref:hypothetical protein n=1 Tax=Myxococcus stipitatus TaxID=83455 RepID=UPI003145604B